RDLRLEGLRDRTRIAPTGTLAQADDVPRRKAEPCTQLSREPRATFLAPAEGHTSREYPLAPADFSFEGHQARMPVPTHGRGVEAGAREGRTDPGTALVPGRSVISQPGSNLKSPTVATLFRICEALEVWAADRVKRADVAKQRRQGG